MISTCRIMVGFKARAREHSCRQVGIRLPHARVVLKSSSARVRRAPGRTSLTAAKLKTRRNVKPVFQDDD
jgi:hypothetical protein